MWVDENSRGCGEPSIARDAMSARIAGLWRGGGILCWPLRTEVMGRLAFIGRSYRGYRRMSERR